MNKSVKKIGCMILSGVLGISMMPVSIYAKDEHPTEKNETIFTVLNGDGSVDSTIVSSWIHDEDGIQNIQEDLNLQNVENVKTDEEPDVQGQTYTWNAKGNDVYYQGTSQQKLPVQISIEYRLDGKEISAEDLKNQSGHLQVLMHCQPMLSKVVHGITIHPSYVLAGGIVLEDDKIQNVSSDQGKIIDDGNRKMFVFATIPGMEQTLQEAGLSSVSDQFHISDTISWEADVHDFDQDEWMMAMSNELSMQDLPQLNSAASIQPLLMASDALLDGTRQLKDGSQQLEEGVKPLASVYPQMDALTQGMHQLYQGSGILKESVQQYTGGVHQLHEGSHSLYDLAQGTNQIYTSEQDLVAGIEQLEMGLSQLESKTSAVDLKKSIEAISQCMESLHVILQKDQAVFSHMQQQMQTVQTALSSMQQSMVELSKQVQSMNQVALRNNEKAKGWKQQQQKAIEALDQSIQTLHSVESTPEVQDAIASLELQKETLINMQSQMDFETFDMSSMLEISQSMAASVQQFQSMMADTNQVLQQLNQDMQKAQNILDTLSQASQSDFMASYQQLVAAIHQLNLGAKSLKAGSLALNQGLKTLKDQTKKGADSIYGSSQLLDEKGSALLQGAADLESGLQEVDSKKEQLQSLKGGLSALTDAVDQLSQGSQMLYDGQSLFNQEVQSKANLTMAQLETLTSVVEEMKEFNEEVKVFAGTPEGSVHTSRFVFRLKA